ncbi:MAG: secretin and TonB N-terminal domain-containing protein [Candidatus Omnitrophota bacterium]
MKNKIAFICASFLFMAIAPLAQGSPLPAAGAGISPEAGTKEAALSDPLKEMISVDYKDVDIADVLRSLSYTYGLNLVTSSDVKGKITVSLKDVSIGEALEAILSGNGYNYSRKGNMLYISPGSVDGAQVITVPIILKYIKAADAQNLVRKSSRIREI